jgi:hypothetical protein
MPAPDGKEITVHGDLAQLPEGSHTSIPPRALYLQRFAIERAEDERVPRPR